MWDAIIVGTGMGGASIGFRLAQSGWRILFLEKGKNHLNSPDAIYDDFAETFLKPGETPAASSAHTLLRAGRWHEPIVDRSGTHPVSFIPLLGSGTGGSTALYGMALERLRREDIEQTGQGRGTAERSSLPDTWPVRYNELVPYYEQAETLFGVCGDRDQLIKDESKVRLNSAPRWGSNANLIAKHLKTEGLHPYRLPVACQYEKGDDRSQGYLDSTGSKRDASLTCLQPAIEKYGATLFDQCEVMRMDADKRGVKTLHGVRNGRPLSLEAPIVILAAGALATPALLLNSTNAHWPNGLANHSDLVGRNLMRHAVDLYMLRLANEDPRVGHQKELAFNDWYQLENGKGGTIQSFGDLPPAEVLAAELVEDLRDERKPVRAMLARLGRPALVRVLRRLQRTRVTMASILEDLPYLENRVLPGNKTALTFTYHMMPEQKVRVAEMRSNILNVFSPFNPLLIKQAENNKRLAHVCGTCRFGNDPKNSVLDAQNKAHGIDNLYVVDASFFPSSGGTNPGLTIAANALRVADHLIDRTGIGSRKIQKSKALTNAHETENQESTHAYA